jgi:ankyrin repeat protein
MSRSLTRDSSLENFRHEAKRWRNALRAGDADARRRLLAVLPGPPADPGLRDVQLALAREYGFAGWTALRQALDDLALARRSLAERVEMVLRAAMWQGDRASAARILARWPEIATANIYAAAATGTVAEIARRLAADPAAATRKGGPLEWEPLLYLAYARFAAQPQGLEAARLLLDHGADPNARWVGPWGEPAFTVLTGVIGEGEGVQPPHPQARALAALLIERGADPYDPQALYNTSIVGDDVGWLAFLWSASERRGRSAAWTATSADKPALGGKVPLNAVDYLLGNAVAYNHLARAAWLLAHGADANSPHAYSGRPQQVEALVYGHQEMAELLARHGARATPLDGQVAFQAACMRLDRAAARRLAEQHPACLKNPEPMLTAARSGRSDVVALLLELGMDVDIADETEQRGLHNAVLGGSLDVVKLLVAHGADIDRPTTQFGGAMGFAAHFRRHEIAAFLAPLSRDVHNMTDLGLKARLRDLFATEPALVNARHARYGVTPLFFLPDSDDDAMDMAVFLLAHGADLEVRDEEGRTPEQIFRQQGREEIADFLHDEGRAR